MDIPCTKFEHFEHFGVILFELRCGQTDRQDRQTDDTERSTHADRQHTCGFLLQQLIQ